jgi:superfamily II DNA/RNA helicase
LIARGRADRVLIVAPASLKMQWREEMSDKFDREFTVYDREYVNAIRSSTGESNVWEHDDFVVTSIDFAKQDDLLEPLEEAEWDVAVFDEAHHLTARRSTDGSIDKTDRYNVAEAVSPNTDGLLFLTGTPHKGKHDQFYLMLDLLEPYRFEDEHDISPEKLDDLMIRRLKSNPNMVHSDGAPMFPEKTIETVPVEFSEEENQLYEDITDYLRTQYRQGEEQESQAAGFSMVIYQKRLVSSIRAIQRSLEKRASALQSGGEDANLSKAVEALLPQYRNRPETLEESQRRRIEEELQTADTGASVEDRHEELETVEELIRRCKSIEVDSKARKLRETIEDVLAEDPDEKVLAFTEYTDTLEYLRDEVLADHDVAQIHGGLGQATRREQVEKFRNEANVMLATDAAREGINLQFAHIMVNYDLPWNPIRIDQRMGRLHRYGQNHPVSISNLFVEDTRESKILEQLVTKIDNIEDDLGMRSDVLGMVLDDSDFDLEDRIMDAVANEESEEEIVEDIDTIIEERKDAVKTVQENFLISDQFGESDLEEVQEIIEESRKDRIGQSEVRKLVERFFDLYDGSISRRASGDANGEIYRLNVPSVLELDNDDVRGSYKQATFSKEVARERSGVDFLSLNHPLVREIIDYCLDRDWIDGRTAVKRSREVDQPGLLCTFRLGYETADGSDETEELVPLYVTAEGDVREFEPKSDGALTAEEAAGVPAVDRVSENASDCVEAARRRGQTRVEELAEEAEAEKAETVSIKREHAERYFKNATKTWESRLEEYQQKQRDGENMELPIRRAQSKLQELREARKEEFEQLQQEETALPKSPELVSAAVFFPGEG